LPFFGRYRAAILPRSTPRLNASRDRGALRRRPSRVGHARGDWLQPHGDSMHLQNRRHPDSVACRRHVTLAAILLLPLNPIMRTRVSTLMPLLTRRVFLTVLLTTAATAPLAAQSTLRDAIDRSRLRVGTDSFAVIMQGKTKGWQRLTMARDGKGWQVGDAITIDSMVTQGSIIRFDADLHERSLRQEGVMMGRPMKISLDWQNGRVQGTAMTPSSGPSGSMSIDTVALTGVIDDNAVAPLLAVVRWRDSMEFSFPVLSSGKGTVSQQRLRVVGTESTTVPAGVFDTWKIELRADRSLMIANVTKTAPYRVVRMRNGPAFEMQLLK
jgi:hypothetical protein